MSALPNLLMISGDATPVAGRQGAFFSMLHSFSVHWGRIDVIVPKPERLERTEFFGNVFFHPAASGKAWQWRHILRTGRALHEERPYGLMTSHDYGFHYNGLGSWLLHRATRTPYVSEILHVTGHPRAADARERLQYALARVYIALARRVVRGFRVDNGRELPRLLERWGVRRDQILVLYAVYIDHGIFKRRAGVPKRHDVIFCGRLDTNKGAHLVLRAIGLLAARGRRVTLLMRAAGREEARLKALARELGIASQIEWRPWVASAQELADLYSGSRMLVCASFSEGGPRVAVEAMACGVPVVTTPVGLMHELIEPGRTGTFVDWTPESIASAVAALLDDDRGRDAMGEAACTRVAAFQRDAVIGAYAAAYRALAGAPMQERPV